MPTPIGYFQITNESQTLRLFGEVQSLDIGEVDEAERSSEEDASVQRGVTGGQVAPLSSDHLGLSVIPSAPPIDYWTDNKVNHTRDASGFRSPANKCEAENEGSGETGERIASGKSRKEENKVKRVKDFGDNVCVDVFVELGEEEGACNDRPVRCVEVREELSCTDIEHIWLMTLDGKGDTGIYDGPGVVHTRKVSHKEPLGNSVGAGLIIEDTLGMKPYCDPELRDIIEPLPNIHRDHVCNLVMFNPGCGSKVTQFPKSCTARPIIDEYGRPKSNKSSLGLTISKTPNKFMVSIPGGSKAALELGEIGRPTLADIIERVMPEELLQFVSMVVSAVYIFLAKGLQRFHLALNFQIEGRGQPLLDTDSTSAVFGVRQTDINVLVEGFPDLGLDTSVCGAPSLGLDTGAVGYPDLGFRT